MTYFGNSDILAGNRELLKYTRAYPKNILQGTIDCLKEWFPNANIDYSNMAAYAAVLKHHPLEEKTDAYNSDDFREDSIDNKVKTDNSQFKIWLAQLYISHLAYRSQMNETHNTEYAAPGVNAEYAEPTASKNNNFHQYLVDFVMKQKGHRN